MHSDGARTVSWRGRVRQSSFVVHGANAGHNRDAMAWFGIQKTGRQFGRQTSYRAASELARLHCAVDYVTWTLCRTGRWLAQRGTGKNNLFLDHGLGPCKVGQDPDYKNEEAHESQKSDGVLIHHSTPTFSALSSIFFFPTFTC